MSSGDLWFAGAGLSPAQPVRWPKRVEPLSSARYNHVEVPTMNRPELIASILTGSIVLIAIVFRLLVAGSQIAGMSALGRLPGIPKRARAWIDCWFLGDPASRANS